MTGMSVSIFKLYVSDYTVIFWLREVRKGKRTYILIPFPRHNPRDTPKHSSSLQRRRNIIPLPINLPHTNAHLQRTINLTLHHQIPPHHPLLIPARSQAQLALLHILGQIQIQRAQRYTLDFRADGVELLDHLEVDYAFRQVVGFVDCETEGDGFRVVPADFVLEDGGFGGAAVVFG